MSDPNYAQWIEAIGTGVLALLAIIAGIVACKELRTHRESSDRESFSAFLSETSSEDASFDRGLVRELRSGMKAEEIRALVEQGRKLTQEIHFTRIMGQYPDNYNVTLEALKGIAIERTLVRYDRVAFFLLGESNRLKAKPPTWLWTELDGINSRLRNWVDYRRSNNDDAEYFRKDHVEYLVRLIEMRKKTQGKG